jgi:filamentous hemagglutinin family protein
MNRAYRLIWNDRLDTWSVVAEFTRARGKRSLAAALLLASTGAITAYAGDLAPGALPGGGTVTAGQASISTSGARMDIHQSSQRAIINWQNFDIGSQASVNFQQPNTSAIALNRVSGPTASRIEGQLTANGQVFLINPNGVLFGNGARVNVGGLAVSTLDIRDQDFLASNYTFSGSGGTINNQGQINAAPGGYLAFIAPNVSNSGSINAPQGTVAMGAGESVRLNFSGDRLIGLNVSTSTLDTLIENHQAIKAEGGAILLTAAAAEGLTKSVINNTGVIEAGSLTSKGGVIRLESKLATNSGALSANGVTGGEVTVHASEVQQGGTTSATGSQGVGGTVKLLGDRVALIETAKVDVSGALGGGTVLVGGDYQGKNPEIQNASRTYVGSGATIKADATESGDGGKVVVWADDITRYYGNISAQGGSQSGDGGFVEVSGKGYLDFNGMVNTAATNGNVGTLLLDPTNIEVITGGTATLIQVDQFADLDLTGSCASFGGAACSQIAPATINAAGANVILQATNNILFTNAISMTNVGFGLSATATTGNITVSAPITTASRVTSGTTGGVTLTATGGAVAINANITTGDATVPDIAGNQTPATGSIAVTAATGISGTGRLITGNAIVTGAAAGVETSTSGNITLNVTGAGAVGLSASNALTIGSATGNGAGSTATSGNITFTSADRINNGTPGAAIDVSFGIASVGATNNPGSLIATTDGGAGAAGEIRINSGEPLRLGAINAGGGDITLDVASATTAAGVISGVGTTLTKLGAGTLTMSAANTYTGLTTVSAGRLALGAANRIADTSAVTVASGATFDLNNFSETIGSLAGAGTLTQSGAGAVTLATGVDNTSTTFSGVIQNPTGSIALTKQGTGTFVLSGANTYTGLTTVSAGVLNLQNNTATGTTAGGVTVANGAALELQGGITVGAEALSITGTGVGGNGALRNISGNNTWGGTVTLAGASEIQSDAGTLTLSGVVSAPFALAITGAGSLTAVNASNDFSNVSISGSNNVSLDETNAIAIGASNLTGNLSVTANGGATLDTITANTINIASLGGGIVINSGATLTATGPDAFGSLILRGNHFVNNAGAGALVASDPGGRFLVWSTNVDPFNPNPAIGDVRGGIGYDFKQYGYAGGATSDPNLNHNGFLYTLAPTITPGLASTTVSKTYDGNNTATLTAANYTTAGAVDGDTVNLSGIATYDDKNVTGSPNKTVTANSITIDSASNGTATVYGYTLTSNTASNTIGNINKADYTALSGSKTYDGNATFNTVALTGVNSETFTVGVATADSANASLNAGATTFISTNGVITNVTGDSGNYNALALGTLTTNSATINRADYTALSGSKTYDGNATFNTVALTGVNSETFTVASVDANSKDVVGVSSFTSYSGPITGVTGDTGNYNALVLGSLGTNSATITPAALVVTADNKSKLQGQTNPPFTATYAGFVGGETQAVLGGSLAFSTPATTSSPIGAYAITPFGQSSTNYAITYVDGVLKIIGIPPGPPSPIPPSLTTGGEGQVQQAIGAQYAHPISPDDTLPVIRYVWDEDKDEDENGVASVVRIVDRGIRLPL